MPAAAHAVRHARSHGLARCASAAISGPSSHARDKPLRTGICFDPLMPIDRWKSVGARIAAYSDAASWWLGDWLTFGQAKYGRRYKEGIALTGLEYQTLRNYATVARRFDLSRRRDNLSFQHHAEVCSLTDDQQDQWLDLAAGNQWSKSELRRRIRSAASDRSAGGQGTVVRLTLERQRENRWREAATVCDLTLEAWVAQVLDDAASSMLDGFPRR
jgi:hypothetical protein